MVGGQDFGLAGFVVGIATLIGTAGLAAGTTPVALAFVLKAETNEVCAAAVVAKNSLGHHAKQSTTTTYITALPNFLIFERSSP